ncbi:Uncharacterized membrane protein [Lentibacillus persicus]|uniref:Uncharacterized membrane protein n=1 Tax=Lentibacillus persicus TaxID=640948 RepID=A0A1I1VGG5_9BACI|nr:DUF2207 domain-containing protein [Lentibacillus persicus]SFD81068.1 Uncharacterized membrane protein [Lentibacillus persicus]
MKKLFTGLFLFLLTITLFACSEDRSFSIDEVTIDAQINKDGSISVRELFTYNFNGSYEGMTRSIESDEKNFEAYLTESQDPLTSTENLPPLETEEDDDTYKIYTDSANETKRVLYRYEIEGSVKKYTDVADLKYAFFDDSNDTDLNNLTINIHPPEGTEEGNQHFFLHEDEKGTLTSVESGIQYQTSRLEANSNSQIRFVFPSNQLSGMKLTSDKPMVDSILAEEQELAARAENLEANMATVTPIVIILLGILTAGTVIILILHPNRYRGSKDPDSLYRLVEGTDPLFVKYIKEHGRLPDDSLIAGLFSLKQRGIVTLKKVPSMQNEGSETYRFNWSVQDSSADPADEKLRDWLFTERDKKEPYFLLESITAQEDETDKAKQEKADDFRANFDEWSGEVKERENYQQLKTPFKMYSFISIPLLLVSSSLFYYFTTIDTLGSTLQWLLPLIVGIITVPGLLFNRNKWVLSAYYFILLLLSAVSFTFEPTIIMTLFFYGLSILTLLIIPEYYWRKDIRQLKYAIKQAHASFKHKNYPIGADADLTEQRLLYAIILGAGKEYGEQCNSSRPLSTAEMNYPLLQNPVYATTSFSAAHAGLYTAVTQVNTPNTTAATGGGGAGAF